MESLQLAQMLADLSSLNAAEPNAAAALVTANKAIQTVEKTNANPAAPGLPRRPTDELRRVHTHSSQTSRTGTGTASPARVDKFGRRIMMSPPALSRSNSAQGSIPGTPKRDSDVRSTTTTTLQHQPQPLGTGQRAYVMGAEQAEDDMDRASTLMALYEIRAKLKQQDNSSLMKAREKIADLAARQQQQQTTATPGKKEPEKITSRFTFPK
ncbi:hypothetical protein COL5a_003369 [Colletotrichum fioriniae]|uniref:uncharacterized protein n=1 Tax=Colletotrichum fioriniae TaxID=710243 RepID=UPI002300C1AC|nr:uncharacterized protein COL516b_000649 [Colletotrichum fioriniae]KAJ0313708.1 hypothetical protein COL516b_000649 [Colletotrichum fioriniae]KAJ0330307.1 hypothetical protein COL5a_003369 [Colletotrichum fioriniae]KAJ3947989.1 hypothetical protein N0V96_002230 [Colletotrichum fioriniae]